MRIRLCVQRLVLGLLLAAGLADVAAGQASDPAVPPG